MNGVFETTVKIMKKLLLFGCILLQFQKDSEKLLSIFTKVEHLKSFISITILILL